MIDCFVRLVAWSADTDLSFFFLVPFPNENLNKQIYFIYDSITSTLSIAIVNKNRRTFTCA